MKNKKQELSFHQQNVVKHTEKRARERYGIFIQSDIDLISKEIIRYRNTHHVSDDVVVVGRGLNAVMPLYREKDKVHYLVEFRTKF